MWNTALLPWNTVASPKPQVSPKSGVRTPMLLATWNRLLFSCLLGLSPTEGLRILVMTTTVMVMFTTTMIRAGMTKASRALVSSQLSQQHRAWPAPRPRYRRLDSLPSALSAAAASGTRPRPPPTQCPRLH